MSSSSCTTTARIPNQVSPTATREVMDHHKVLRVSEENKQVLSAVEALLSLTPVVVGATTTPLDDDHPPAEPHDDDDNNNNKIEEPHHKEEPELQTSTTTTTTGSVTAAALRTTESSLNRIPTAVATTTTTTSPSTATTTTAARQRTTTTTATKLLLPRTAGTVSPCDDSSVEEPIIMSSSLSQNDHPTSSSGGGSPGIIVHPTHHTGPYFEGSCDLWCPEDEECLSQLHCFMRKYCVEAFTAKAFDISTPKFGRSLGRCIVVGQLGIQCKWCKHRTYTDRQERAVCFPSTIKNIYHSIETWQRRHSAVCGDIPPWAKTQMTNLMKCSRSGAGGRRLYWEESAKRLGMVDTDSGVRFQRPPGPIDPPPVKNIQPRQQLTMITASCDDGGGGGDQVMVDNDVDGGDHDHPPSLHSNPSHRLMITIDTTVAHPIVNESDLDLQITGYLFCLLEQMESCYFSDEDRIGGRSKVKSCQSGYPGIQCKHCGGKSGFGRYFPASCAALASANSDRNIFNHISKCRKCPEEVRDRLTTLFKQQTTFKNRRGTRKIFFERIWARMHQQEEPDLPSYSAARVANKNQDDDAMTEPSPPPPPIVRENDKASAPVWHEPPPTPPPLPRQTTTLLRPAPRPLPPPPEPKQQPQQTKQQPQELQLVAVAQPMPRHQVVQQHQQQQHPSQQHHQVQQQHPGHMMPQQPVHSVQQIHQQHRPGDLVPLPPPPPIFQEVPHAPIVQHVPRRVDHDMVLQPAPTMTMMMVPIQDLPLMHQHQALVHEQRIQQQLQIRSMHQQPQQHHHHQVVVLQHQQQHVQAHHHQAMQQQHAMQRQQQQQQLQQHHLMVQRPTAQRPYLPHPNMQFAGLADQQHHQQPQQVATAVPYSYHHPYAASTNMTSSTAVAVPYTTYQSRQFRLSSDGTADVTSV